MHRAQCPAEFLWKTAVFIFHSPCGVRKSEARKAINTATPACHLCLWCLQGRSPQGPTSPSAVHCQASLPLSSADGPASTTGAIQARGPRCTSTLVLQQTASPSSSPLLRPLPLCSPCPPPENQPPDQDASGLGVSPPLSPLQVLHL